MLTVKIIGKEPNKVGDVDHRTLIQFCDRKIKGKCYPSNNQGKSVGPCPQGSCLSFGPYIDLRTHPEAESKINNLRLRS